MISIVNGYVCLTSCEAASARAGKNPNAPPGTLPGQSGKTDKVSGPDGRPATVLGGALKNPMAANTVTAAGGTTSSSDYQPGVDLLI